MPYTVDEEIGFHFRVFDGADQPVTGLVSGNFTKLLALDGANVASPAITVAEVGNGRYYATFTPDEVGFWYAAVSHATYMPRGVDIEYKVSDQEELSPETIAAAVWAFVMETGFSAKRYFKIALAVLAGKSTGGKQSFTARNLGDTADMLVGSADQHGNRTPTSYGAE